MSITSRYRTHTCGNLDLPHIDKVVSISGWCHRIRDHGGVLFIDLRDTYGLTQVVVDPDSPAYKDAEQLRSEWVIQVTGRVSRRPEGTDNEKIATGLIEVRAEAIEVLGAVEGALPMPVFGDVDYPEDIRLKHRFLDLRREPLQNALVKRAEIIQYIREEMWKGGFLEVQTPILTASSPEGARDFLVPSRLHPGKFYALPQAPQQFKQLLMVGGIDRYFQIAPCFRDEAARADRSPGEFYQLDIEMAFVTQDEVFAFVEPLLRDLFRNFGGGRAIDAVFPRITYADSMLRYGNDKPDLRNVLTIADVTDILLKPEMTLAPFREALEKGGVARAIYIPPPSEKSRKWFKELEGWIIEQGGKGLGYLTAQNGLLSGGPLAKFMGGLTYDLVQATIPENPILDDDAVIFLLVGEEELTVKLAGLLRTRLGEDLGLIEEDVFRFAWIVDYPMFERDEHGKIGFSHNPFSMPQGGLEALEGDPLKVLAYQYDIVCNGIELSSGAIRNHRPDIMEKAFALAGYSKEDLEQKFGGMLSAFRCGAPPHGGIAPGIDRMVMMLCGAENLREVVAFPMNQKGEDLMMGAPSAVAPEQMAELHIRPTLQAKA
jgi:aspartyl-tRNA synthetase